MANWLDGKVVDNRRLNEYLTSLIIDVDLPSGERTMLTTYDKLFDPAGTEQFQAATDDPCDWCTAGIVLKP